jgi:hypothetical protein
LLKGPQKVAPLTQEQLALRAQQFKTANTPDSDASEQADRMTGNKVLPTAVPANPNKQASNTGSALVKPPAPPALGGEFKSQFDTSQMGKIQSPEEVYAQQQKIRALTGVSEDPLAQARERTAKLEAKYAKDSEDDSRAGLMSILRGYAKAGSEHPERGFGYAAASGSESSAKFDKEMNELRNNQMKEITTIKNLQDKEDDARKRGDAKGIEDAIAKQKDAQFKLYELANQEKTASAAYENAQTNKAKLPFEEMAARAHLNQSAASLMHARRPTSEEFAYQMYKTDPAYFNAKNPKENAAVQAALKNYFEGTLSLKLQKDFPNPESYLSSLGLATKTGGGAGGFPVTVNGKTYSFPTQQAADDFKAKAGTK